MNGRRGQPSLEELDDLERDHTSAAQELASANEALLALTE
jgi:hypothetical protein